MSDGNRLPSRQVGCLKNKKMLSGLTWNKISSTYHQSGVPSYGILNEHGVLT